MRFVKSFTVGSATKRDFHFGVLKSQRRITSASTFLGFGHSPFGEGNWPSHRDSGMG